MMTEINVTLGRPVQLLLFKPADGVPIDKQDKYQLLMAQLIEEGWAVSELVNLGRVLADPRKWTRHVQAMVD